MLRLPSVEEQGEFDHNYQILYEKPNSYYQKTEAMDFSKASEN